MAARSAQQRLAASGREALVTIAATIGSFLTALWAAALLHADSSVAIMAAALALTLGRRAAPRGSAAQLLQWAALPLVGLAAAAIGAALLAFPILGAALFTLGMSSAIWLRRFGARARALATTLALPLVAILVVPPPRIAGAPGASLALALAAGVIALAWVRALQSLARRAHLVPEARADDVPAEAPAKNETRKLSATTKFALQMAVALGAAFLAGHVLFPQHWSWVVLTAFIVCAGNHGRGDVVYKSILRVAGAVAGTAAAAGLALVPHLGGPAEAALIFGALFAGLTLRELNYAYWACCMTLVVALLQRDAGDGSWSVLATRLEGILVGAACGIAASWFVVPIRTRSVVFLRLSHALAALEETLQAEHGEARAEKARTFEARVERLETVAPPLHLHWRVLRKTGDDDHPHVWIEAMRACRARVRDRSAGGADAARAVRSARRALGRRARPDPSNPSGGTDDSLSRALQRIHAAFDAEGKAPK